MNGRYPPGVFLAGGRMIPCRILFPGMNIRPFQLLLDGDLSSQQWKQILIACGILVVALLVGFVVVSLLKRYAAKDDTASAGFTLSDLRRLYKEGQMSEEEFNKAKAMVVESAKRAAERAEERRAGAKQGPDKSRGLF
jgi:hypothetical protein